MTLSNALCATLTATLLSACGQAVDQLDQQNKEQFAETNEAPSGRTSPDNSSFANLTDPYNTLNYSEARSLFRNNCSSCHTLHRQGGHGVGPNLSGVFDRQVGSLPDFSYSRSLADANFEWSPEALDQWLQNPRDFLPGNRMTFSGFRREQDRQKIIAYLMAQTGYSSD